jgi:hypothetical protein
MSQGAFDTIVVGDIPEIIVGSSVSHPSRQACSLSYHGSYLCVCMYIYIYIYIYIYMYSEIYGIIYGPSTNIFIHIISLLYKIKLKLFVEAMSVRL